MPYTSNPNNVNSGNNNGTVISGNPGYIISNSINSSGTIITGGGSIGTGNINYPVISVSNGNASLGTVVFSNGNGVTFGINNNTITASISQQTQSASSLYFSNSNGVTFGTNGSTVTASISFPAQTNYVFSNSNGISFGTNGSTVTASVNPSGLTFSNSNNVSFTNNGGTVIASASFSQSIQSASSLIFSNGNGVTFGTNGSTLTASVATNYQSQGAYLTTAMQSNASTISNINLSAGTTSNNLSNFVLSNANGISFGLNGNTITGTVQTNYLTTAMLSNASSAFAGTNNGATGATITVNTSGVSVSITQSNQALSGSNGSFTFQTASFGNLNGLSFYSSNGSIVGSYSVPSIAGFISNINISAGSTSNNLSAFTFSNGSGVSFGLNGSVITASVAAAGGAQTGISGISGGTTQMTSGTAVFSNSNGVTFGVNGNTITASVQTNYQSQGAYLTTAMQSNAATISNINLSAGTTSQNLSNFVFSNSNGVGFGLNGSTITASQSTLVYSNSNNVTFGTNGSTLTASASFAQTNQNISLYALGNTTQNSSTVLNASNLSFNGLGNVSVGFSNGSIQISQTGGGGGITNINISAGTTSNNLTNFVFSNSNSVSFGLNGSTLTASYSLPMMSMFDTPTLISSSYNGIGQSSITLAPVYFPLNLSASAAAILANLTAQTSTNNTMQGTLNILLALYSLNGVSISLASSGSQQYTYSFTSTQSSAIMSGIRRLTVPFNINATPGNYWYGVNIQTATANTSNGSMNVSVVGNAGNMSFNGDWTMATNVTSMQILPFLGNYSAISAGFPSNIQKSEMKGSGGTPNRIPWIGFYNI